jgi:hypothetical protein
LGACSITT